jgi:hypothetical protein
MPGLVRGVHVFLVMEGKQDVDGRDKPGHDGVCCYTFNSISVVSSSLRPNHALMPAVRFAM